MEKSVATPGFEVKTNHESPELGRATTDRKFSRVKVIIMVAMTATGFEVKANHESPELGKDNHKTS